VSIQGMLGPDKKSTIYFTRKLSGFVQILDFIPSIIDDNGVSRLPSELKTINFSSHEEAGAVLALLNSNLFYWFLTLYSDVRNLNKREILGFPVVKLSPNVLNTLNSLGRKLMSSFKNTSKVLIMKTLLST
jgi:hypothetical protein